MLNYNQSLGYIVHHGVIIATYGMTIGLSIMIDQHNNPSSAETQTQNSLETRQEILSLPAGDVTYGYLWGL